MASQDDHKSLSSSEIFNCATGVWPIKYFGVPVSGARLHVMDWLKLDEKIYEKIRWLAGSSLSIVGRLTLINSCLSPIYSMHVDVPSDQNNL